LVQRAIKAYNNLPHTGIMDAAPNEVSNDEELQFLLQEKAAQGLQHNQELGLDRGAQLERRGAFREELPNKGRGFERNFRPRYGGEVHAVSKVAGTTVFSSGKAYSTRHVLPVSADSGAVSTEGLTGGSEQVNKARLESVRPFKDRLVEYLGSWKWLHEMADQMKELGMAELMKNGLNYKKALELLGFEVDARGKVTYKKSPAESAAGLRAPTRRLRAKTASAAA
jgi:hypothetical protein